MPKLRYQLKKYIKAVEILVIQKGFDHVEIDNKSGSAVRFELFMPGDKVPCVFWVVHTQHTRNRELTSTEDYRKAARNLCVDFDDFINLMK